MCGNYKSGNTQLISFWGQWSAKARDEGTLTLLCLYEGIWSLSSFHPCCYISKHAWINECSCKPGAISRFQTHCLLWQMTMRRTWSVDLQKDHTYQIRPSLCWYMMWYWIHAFRFQYVHALEKSMHTYTHCWHTPPHTHTHCWVTHFISHIYIYILYSDRRWSSPFSSRLWFQLCFSPVVRRASLSVCGLFLSMKESNQSHLSSLINKVLSSSE